MSRYLLLFILTLPFIVLAITGIVTRYKMNRITKRRAVYQVCFWLVISVGLASADFIYSWLLVNELTVTDSLSLFDVVQIFLIVFLLYVVNGQSIKLETTEQRLNDLHQELSIQLSTKEK